MPKRAIAALVTTALAVVLLLSFKTPSQQIVAVGGPAAIVGQPSSASAATAAPTGATAVPAPVGATTLGAGSGGGTVQAAPAAPTVAPTPPPTTSKVNATVTGPVVDTPFGPVQVRVSVVAGKIVDVVALQTPSDRMRSQMIAQYAVPILRQEALQAQSASIDIVSGATYTSEGYAQSLQAALDQAHA